MCGAVFCGFSVFDLNPLLLEASMKTTLAIDEKLLDEAKTLSGAKTKREAVEIALNEFVRKKKARKLLDLENKVELSFTLKELLSRRKRQDSSHRSE
jgi:Arc/MetJ family transcription regulator